MPAKAHAGVRAFLVLFTLFGFLWTALAGWTNNPKIASFALLPFVAVAFLNTLQHIFYSIYFRQYTPGLITSVGLYLPICGVGLSFMLMNSRRR